MARYSQSSFSSLPISKFKRSAYCAAIAALTAPALADDKPYEEIVVTATKLSRSVQDIAGTVSVITQENIEQQQVNDLNELVNYLPGVSMNTASRGGNQGFIIRGIGGNRVLTVIDGVRSNDIYQAGPSAYGRDLFEVDDLKAVEIIRGPASVLYGADAMGGAVLLRTKDPRDYLSGDSNSFFNLRAASSSDNEQTKLGFSTGWVSDNFETVVQFTQRDFAEREVNSDARIDPQDGEVQDLMWKTIWSPAGNHRFALTLDALQEAIVTELDSEEQSPSVEFSRGEDESERLRASLNYLLTVQSGLADSIESQVYWQRNDALQHTDQIRTSYSFINPMNPASFGGTTAFRDTDFEFNQTLWGADITALKSFNTGAIEHAMVYGLHLDETDTERPRNRCETELSTSAVTCNIAAFPFAPTEDFPNKTFPDTTTTRTGVYLQNEMVFGNSGFTLIPGLRFDNYEMQAEVDDLLDVAAFGFEVVDMDDSEASVSLGAIYDLNTNTSLFLQYAEGFRPPNYDESNQAFVNFGFGYATVPNPDINPENSQGVELGIKSLFANTELSLTLYDNHYEDFISSEFIGMDGAISLFQDRNIAEVHIRGAEVEARYYLNNNWQFSAAAAYSRGDNETDDTPLDSIDPLTTVLTAGYFATSNKWSVQSFVTWADDKDRVSDDTVTTASSYSVVDLVAHFNVTDNLSLRAGVFNLFDEEYAQWSNISGLPAGSDSIETAKAPGTNYRLNINYQL